METLNVSWIYPDMLNLHGDRGNIMAISRIAKLMNMETNISKIEHYNQKIDFENTDIIIFNPGELKIMPTIIQSLKEQQEELDKYINDNKMIILIGTSGSIMCQQIIKLNGEVIQGLGYLNMICKERKSIYGNDIYFNTNEDGQPIIGCQIQILDIELQEDISLGKIIYGHGNNHDGTEGAQYKNVIFTNALGPVLVKNPWYTEKLITKVIKCKKQEEPINKIDESQFSLEKEGLESIKKFINNK